MKHNNYFFNNLLLKGFYSLLILTFLANCKDDEPQISTNPLVGTWVMESIAYSGCNDPEENGSIQTTCTSVNCSKIVMTSEGVFKVVLVLNSTPAEDAGTYLVMGDVIEICVLGGTECSNMSYKLLDNNSRLKFTETDGDTGCTSVVIYKKS
jgi:hypothetical protein